jgi:hypothetical protein
MHQLTTLVMCEFEYMKRSPFNSTLLLVVTQRDVCALAFCFVAYSVKFKCRIGDILI